MSQQQKDGFFFHPRVKSKQAGRGRPCWAPPHHAQRQSKGQRAARLGRLPLRSLSRSFGLALIGAESTGCFYRDEPRFKRPKSCIGRKSEGRREPASITEPVRVLGCKLIPPNVSTAWAVARCSRTKRNLDAGWEHTGAERWGARAQPEPPVGRASPLPEALPPHLGSLLCQAA